MSYQIALGITLVILRRFVGSSYWSFILNSMRSHLGSPAVFSYPFFDILSMPDAGQQSHKLKPTPGRVFLLRKSLARISAITWLSIYVEEI